MLIQWNSTAKLRLGIAGLLALSTLAAVAQPAAAPPVAPADTPAWQRAAGGHAEFEVASVREDPAGKFVQPGFSMDADDSWADTGGLLNLDTNLATLISFAYRLPQLNRIANLPDWAKSKHFVIQARAAGNPTKDQARLMMQLLLAQRFKLAIHFEDRETSVLVMTLRKPGTVGPGLRLHADGPPCSVVKPPTPGAPVTFDMFPCQGYMANPNPDGTILTGARNTTVELMAAFFTSIGHLRPIVDRTQITAPIDFSMTYMAEKRGVAPVSTADEDAGLPGTSFLEAVHDQLGLKLEPAKMPLPVPVIDHIEQPSEN